MKTVFKNACVITMDNVEEILTNAQVEIVDNKITYVGENRESDGNIIDAGGNIIMPGFVNAHCHLAMTLFRGKGENSQFNDWWKDYMRPLEAKLQEDDCYWASALGMFELIKNGVTCVADFYMNPQETARASVDIGIRANIGIGAITGREVLSRDYLDDEIDKISISPTIKPLLYAHSVYSCDVSQFVELNSCAKRRDLIKSTHASETLYEVGKVHATYNMTPIGLLESYGFLDTPTLLAHCVHCDKGDIEIMKNYPVTVVTNPSSNLMLGSGIAPLYSYVRNGINVAIGTDGPASNNSLNMFKEMFLADNLQSGVLNQAHAINTIDALKMATIRGALALGYDNLGKVKVGYLADIVMIDVHQPNMQPLKNIYNNLVNSCQSSNVILTMIDGKIVYKDGQFLTSLDYEKVIDRCNKIIERIEN